MRKLSLIGFSVLFITSLIFISCQNELNSPTAQYPDNYQLIKANPQVVGLAKEVGVQEWIDFESGGTLGGEATFGNYVVIPPGALSEDMLMSFSLDVSNDGVLIATVEKAGAAPGEHLYFEDGKVSTLVVNKDWLAGQPDVAINIDTGELYNIDQDANSFAAQLPHFTRYSWGWLE